MGDYIAYINLALSVVILIFGILLIVKNKKSDGGISGGGDNEELYKRLAALSERVDNLNRDTDSRHSTLRTEVSNGITNNVSRLGDSLRDQQEKQLNNLTAQLKRIEEEFGKIRSDTLEMLEKIQRENAQSMEKVRSENKQNLAEVQQKLDRSKTETTEILNKMQTSNGEAMEKLRADNQKSLDKINDTVNEKLQKTLNDKISQSFEAVNKRLTEVYQGLGEMKKVAEGVTDLKKVLSNVKTRGIMGEIQLASILSEILSAEQFAEQVSVIPGDAKRVDFAVKLPGSSPEQPVWLPIDSKFPADAYQSLLSAYDSGDVEEIRKKRSLLESEIKAFAKSISEKYIAPPHTTDFAIMFLPFEGLYAEVINLGLVEYLQREYKINITGPSTMAAMLNSLQMGFRTLEIQQKSGEVWKILEQAKKEFANFENVLDGIRKKLNNVDGELELLIGRRTRAINRSLKEVRLTTEEETALNLETSADFSEDDE